MDENTAWFFRQGFFGNGKMNRNLWDIIETRSGEHHMVPDTEPQRHIPNRECWCRPWRDEGVWVHNDPPNRPGKAKGEPPIPEGSGIPGDP